MPGKALVVDANILIRAALGKRVRKVIETYAGQVSFFVPEVAYAEAEERLPALEIKRGGDPEKVLAFLRSLAHLVEPIGSEVYGEFEAEARERLGERDPEDWPILASALAVGCPVWTEDTDFFGCGAPTWTSSRVDVSARSSKITRDAKALNLIGAQLVGLAAGWDFDKPGGELGNEAPGNFHASIASRFVAVHRQDDIPKVAFQERLLSSGERASHQGNYAW